MHAIICFSFSFYSFWMDHCEKIGCMCACILENLYVVCGIFHIKWCKIHAVVTEVLAASGFLCMSIFHRLDLSFNSKLTKRSVIACYYFS